MSATDPALIATLRSIGGRRHALTSTRQRAIFGPATGPPEENRRPRHILSGLVTCGSCGGSWTIHSGVHWGCSHHKEGGKHACANNRIVSTDRLETRMLHGLQHYMLNEELIEIYVKENRTEFTKPTRELGREGDRLKKRHGEAAAKIERLSSERQP